MAAVGQNGAACPPIAECLLPLLRADHCRCRPRRLLQGSGPGPSVDLFLNGWGTGDFGNVTMIRTDR